MLASFHHQCLQLTQKVLKYGYATVCPDGENHCALEPGCWCRCRALPTHTHVFAIWGSMLANFSGRFCIQQGSPPNCRPRHRVSVCVWGLPPHLCPGRAGAAPLGTAEERVEGERFSDSACFFEEDGRRHLKHFQWNLTCGNLKTIKYIYKFFVAWRRNFWVGFLTSIPTGSSSG